MGTQEMIREIHENAVEHGWWDEERNEKEIGALICSEWAEALEEARAGRRYLWEGEMGKPEGVAVELIDGVIRIMDYLGEKCFEAGMMYKEIRDTAAMIGKRQQSEVLTKTIAEFIQDLNELTCDMMRAEEIKERFAIAMEIIGKVVFRLDAEPSVDPIMVLLQKHEYNKRRPYKHGKKF